MIASIATLETERLAAPLYTQLDVAVDTSHIDTTYTLETLGKPPPTLQIARGALAWAQSRGINSFIIVAATPHLWRALRDTEAVQKEMGTNIAVYPSALMDLYPDFDWFDPMGTQWYTNSPWTWMIYDWILKLMPYEWYVRLKSNRRAQ
jgi:hypothetical protein